MKLKRKYQENVNGPLWREIEKIKDNNDRKSLYALGFKLSHLEKITLKALELARAAERKRLSKKRPQAAIISINQAPLAIKKPGPSLLKQRLLS